MKNFLSAGPAWASNLLSIVLATLLLLQGIGDEVIAFFTTVNCASCIATTKTVLGIVAFVLSLFKAFGASDTKPTTVVNSTLVVLLISSLFSYTYPTKTNLKSQPSTYLVHYRPSIKVPSGPVIA